MTGPSRPKLVTVAPHIGLLDALAGWWLARAKSDPLATADGLFLVPTRRAARSLAEALLRASRGQPLLQPRILAFGGLDETPWAPPGALVIPPPVPAAQRLAVLARFVLAMGGRNGAPTQADRAWLLAAELATLLDDAARAEIDLASALPGAVGEAFASHWQVTLEFLGIVSRAWPAWLAEQGFSDIAAHQTALLDAQTQAWRATPPAIPVIAAGSTGAIPAIARLLRCVAHLPQGLVVLPGLDRDLDADSWDCLADNHPQASLRSLLSALDARREDVADWHDHSPDFAAAPHRPNCPAGRIDAWRMALLPAASLAAWQNPPDLDPRVLDLSGVQRLSPADQQEEAVAVALVLREALEKPGARAALVTPDRQLARRVGAELLRFGIVADDSAGEALAETPPAIFLRLLAEAAVEDFRPVALLALLKHPLAAAGTPPTACRQTARRLERQCLRGPRPGPGLDALRPLFDDANFLDRLAACFQPLLRALALPAIRADLALAALLESAEALAATDEAPGSIRLWAGEDGEALANHLTGLCEALAILPPLRARTLPGLLDAGLAGAAIRTRRALRGREGTEHPRIQIWGLLEARLQTADVMVLAGLTEGVWPRAADSGPWMNRPMRAAVGLPSPEEQVGQSAHDFVMSLCAAPKVILSAAARSDGAPAVPSRWLVRMDSLLATSRPMPHHPAVSWVASLDQPPDGTAQPVPPPAPAPALALRPRRLSVTDIETWLRDPYAIYARHILKLRRLDPLEQSADAADYGRIVHAGLHRFFDSLGPSWPHDAAARLEAAMEWALVQEPMRPALSAWWRPRLRRIAAWAANAEADRRAAGRLALLKSEVQGDWIHDAPAGPFTLHGRADRIERLTDGSIAILDYKTGTPPTAKQLEEGRSPQLPLEAAMAEQGAFGADLAGPASELVFWKISGGYHPGHASALFTRTPGRIPELAQQARDSLRALVADFDRADRAYLSQPSPGAAPRFSDYAQLARVAEWSAAGDVEE